MKPGSDEREMTVWGDGFAEDGWSSIVSVRDWDACSADEYIRVFPGLLPRDAKMPGVLRRHLELCVTVRAWRIGEALGHCSTGALRSLRLSLGGSIDLRRSRTLWFSKARRRPVGGWWSEAAAAIDCRNELADLHVLDGILESMQRDRLPAFDLGTGVLFAFLTGIHAAYVWPEALLSHELFTAAGWLGHLDRGRSALMPSDLAAYFMHVIDNSSSGPVFTESSLAALVGASTRVAAIRTAAEQRLRGRSRVVRGCTGPHRVSLPGRVVASGRQGS